MSKAIYMGLRWKQPLTKEEWWALERWRLARETGWSLEYIDELPFDALREYLSVRDAEVKADPNWKG